MRTGKRVLSICMAMGILVGSLAGCGSKNSAGDSAATASSTAAASSAEVSQAAASTASAEPVELTMWIDSQSEQEYDKIARDTFSKTHPNITFNLVDKAGGGEEFAMAFAAGTAPSWSAPSAQMYSKYVKAGMYACLDDYIAKWDEKDKLADVFGKYTKYQGKQYGVECFLGPIMLAYNKKLFSEAGLQPPKTWDEMVTCAQKITNRDKGIYGYNMLAQDWCDWFYEFYVWQAGGDLTKQNEDGTIELTLDSPACVTALQFYKDLKWKYDVIQGDLTLSWDDFQKQFAIGKAGMMVFPNDSVPAMTRYGMKVEDLGLVAMPVGPSGKPVTSTGVGIHAITANKSKAETDAAWEWEKFYDSRDQLVVRMQDREKKGNVYPEVSIYKDFKQSDYVKVDPAWQDVCAFAATTGRDEYAGKSVLSKYVVAAIQKCLTNKNADPATELKKQQQIAQKEVVDKFNADIKAGKK